MELREMMMKFEERDGERLSGWERRRERNWIEQRKEIKGNTDDIIWDNIMCRRRKKKKLVWMI